MEVILETNRLLLRKYVEEDAEAFFELNSDPRVLRFVPDKQLFDVEQACQVLIDHPIAFEAHFKFTDTFVKDNGQWRLYAGHVTKLLRHPDPRLGVGWTAG